MRLALACQGIFLLLILLLPSIIVRAGFPDLEVSEMSLEPSITVYQGGTLVVRWTERNLGDEDLSYRVGIYLGTEAYETGFLLAYFYHFLAIGGTKSYEANITIPLDLPPGKYYVTVFVDDNNKESEINEYNNFATCPIFVVEAHPDLEVKDLEVSPTWILQGGVITVRWTELNTGPKAAGSYRVGIYMKEAEHGSGYLLGYFQRDGLMARTEASYEATFTIFGVPSGEYTISVFVDDNNDVKETNENNNMVSSTIHVGAPTFTVFSAVDAQSVRLCSESPTFMPNGDVIVGGPFVNYMSAAVAEESDIRFGRDELIVNWVTYKSKWGELDHAIILLKDSKIYVMGTHRYGTRAALLFLFKKPTFIQHAISYVIIKWQDLNMNGEVEIEEIKILKTG